MIQEIIHKYNNKDSLYGNKLTNHLNMGLYALHKIGANEGQLEAFANSYIDHNQLADLPKTKVVMDDQNLEDYLGIDSYYSSYIPYFVDLLEDFPIDQVISKFLNMFIEGSAGGAFHGIIRLAYAYELQDKEELAKALSYMAESYKVFPQTETMIKCPVKDPMEAVLAMSKNQHFKTKEFVRDLIVGRMEDVYEDPEFEKLVSKIDKSHCNNEYFANLLLQLYALTGDFTMLHGFTSTHALRVLSPLIKDYKKVLGLHWYHLQLAYLSTNCSEIKEIPSVSDLLSWEDIFAKVMSLKDVHTIKFVYSLFEQSKLFEDDQLYRTLAQLKVKESY